MPQLVLTDREKGTMESKNYTVKQDNLQKEEMLLTETQVNIYTDGSKTCNHVGSGFVIYIKGKIIAESSIKLSYNASVFQAEVVAIREAVKALDNYKEEEIKYVKIFTDSQATLLALNSSSYTSKIVKQTMDELNDLGEKVQRLEIVWIKANVGHTGNEKADNLAREAEFQEEIKLYIADSWTNYKNEVWMNIYKEWEIRWTDENRFRLTKEFYPLPSKIKAKRTMNLTRKEMTLWIEIVTGQNNLNYIQSKIYNITDQCRFCEEEEETFFHLLIECPCFQETRSELILLRNHKPEDWKLEQILKFANTESIKQALSFEQPQFLTRQDN